MDSDTIAEADQTQNIQEDISGLEGQLPPTSHPSKLDLLRKATKTQKITFLILFVFLFIRMTNTYWPSWISIQDGIGFWLFVAIEFLSFAYMIWINRDDLSSLNINRPFFFILIVSGLLIGLFFWNSLGFMVIGTSVFLFINYRKGWFNFTNGKTGNRKIFNQVELILFSIYLLIPLFTILANLYSKTWDGNLL